MTYISLLPSTIISKGINRSCLIDVEKSIYCTIPNSLAELFSEQKQFVLAEVLNLFDNEDKETFIEYVDFLEEHNFIIRSINLIRFKYYDNKSYHSPFELETLIIDSIGFKDFEDKICKIKLFPEFFQIRFFKELTIDELKKIANYLQENDFLNIELLLSHNHKISEEEYINLYKKHKIFSRIIISNYSENKTLIDKKIICLQEKILDEKQCGKISEKLFMPNLRTVLTSKSCNSCLNRKLSIDKNGNIKNCPSMSNSFGNIKDISLEKALSQPDFKKYWNITKDQIEVCKDCEFRHICTDCRAYVEEPDNDFSKPLKCGYNPYTNEWEEWSTNPLKQKGIAFYEL